MCSFYKLHTFMAAGRIASYCIAKLATSKLMLVTITVDCISASDMTLLVITAPHTLVVTFLLLCAMQTDDAVRLNKLIRDKDRFSS